MPTLSDKPRGGLVVEGLREISLVLHLRVIWFLVLLGQRLSNQIPVWYGPTKDALVDFDNYSGSSKAFCGATQDEAITLAAAYYGDNVTVSADSEAREFEYMTMYENEADTVGQSTISIVRDPDVLDTWFSSGLWPIGTLGWPEDTEEMKRYFPTSTLVTGQDILFFWVARMMMMQMAVLSDRPVAEKIPFDTVYLHGLVRDATLCLTLSTAP